MNVIDTDLSLEERVRCARHRLMLIQAAGDADDTTMDLEELMGAVQDAAREALELLGPVTTAPASVLNWRAKGGA